MLWYGLVVAAGSGSRFRGYKPLALLLNRPVLYYSLAAFEHCARVGRVVVVARHNRLDAVRRLCRRYRFDKVTAVIRGGSQRTDSVRLGLAALPESGLVAVHDAARPLITPALLESGFSACVRYRAVTFGSVATDTLKLVRGSRITQTMERGRVIHTQTPQFFDLALLREAHARAHGSATDDCVLVERLGRAVYWIPSPDPNPKITTRADLWLCAALLKAHNP